MAARGFGLRIGVAAVIMLVAVVGGRVIPSLTRNWLVQRKEKSLPAPPMRRFDKAVLVVTVLALLCWVVRPAHGPTGALLLIVGMLHTARLLRWQGSKTFAEPLLLALHLGYAFLPLGALCIGVSILWQDLVPLAAAQHLWMGGTFGLMTLAMMTRAALGHTRQVLHAGRGTVAIYAFLISSVIARLCAGIWAGSATGLFTLSGVLWIAAFLGFAILYGSALVRAKSVGR